MPFAVERVVVQIAPEDKRRISAKAKKLDIPMSELMRRAAFAYSSKEDDVELGALADAAKSAADNAAASIDDAMSFIRKSNLRIAAMERKAAGTRRSATGSATSIAAMKRKVGGARQHATDSPAGLATGSAA